jgi:DNA repair protein RecO (recombination protein O)
MLVRTRALLLNSWVARESDLILTLLTPELGRVRAAAKGALRSKKRFVGALLNLNELEVELASTLGKEIEFRLDHAEIVKSRMALASDPARLACAAALAELVEKAAPDAEPNPTLYNLLDAGIGATGKTRNFREHFIYFFLQIISRLGYQPVLESCAKCHKKHAAKAKKFVFSVKRGGLVCEDCESAEKNVFPVSLSLGRSLIAISNPDLKKATRVRLSPKDFAAAVDLLSKFSAWHLEKPVNSLEFLLKLLKPMGH